MAGCSDWTVAPSLRVVFPPHHARMILLAKNGSLACQPRRGEAVEARNKQFGGNVGSPNHGRPATRPPASAPTLRPADAKNLAGYDSRLQGRLARFRQHGGRHRGQDPWDSCSTDMAVRSSSQRQRIGRQHPAYVGERNPPGTAGSGATRRRPVTCPTHDGTMCEVVGGESQRTRGSGRAATRPPGTAAQCTRTQPTPNQGDMAADNSDTGLLRVASRGSWHCGGSTRGGDVCGRRAFCAVGHTARFGQHGSRHHRQTAPRTSSEHARLGKQRYGRPDNRS
jgi:hypothetical protein